MVEVIIKRNADYNFLTHYIIIDWNLLKMTYFEGLYFWIRIETPSMRNETYQNL